MKYLIRSLFYEFEILTRDLPEVFSLSLKENILKESRTALCIFFYFVKVYDLIDTKKKFLEA